MQKVIFGLVGGLGLFIFGMKFLSESLQKIASTRVRRWLRSLTSNPLKGIGLGAVVTSLIQSSSVTTVILIGLINAGIINLMQASSVIIGANIGTTITAQIIAFKIAKYALPSIGIGAFMMLVMRKKKVRFWGQLLLSFGIVFLGLKTMSGVVKPLKDIPMVTDFFLQMAKNPFLGIAVGATFTMLVQSSSASIGMLLALATAGLIDFRASLYILLGDNIGTTITAWLASIGGTTSAKRLATFHSLFNVVGAIYFGILIYVGFYEKIVDFITPGVLSLDTIGRNIANAHTLFNVINAIIFIPLIGVSVYFIKKLIPGEAAYIPAEVQYLQDSLLETPAIAIESAKKEISEMSKMSHKAIRTAVEGFFNRDKQSIHYVETQEDAIDNIQQDITYYLSKLSPEGLTEELASEIPALIHSINDVERISDHSVNIAGLTEVVIGDDIKFPDKIISEIRGVYDNINKMFDYATEAILTSSPEAINTILELEKMVDSSHRKFVGEQGTRLLDKECSTQETLILVDLINNLEKIGDHLTNIAQAAQYEFAYTKQ